MRFSTPALTALAACLAVPSTAGELGWGGGALVGSPRGELGRQIGTGGGVYGHALYGAREGALAVRVDGSFFLYGSETLRVPFSSSRGLDRIEREVRTDNWIGDLVVGPQLTVPIGRVRPYVNAFAGVAYYSTTSELVEPFPIGPTLSSTNFDDAVFSYGGGAGILVPIGKGRTAVDAGVRWVHGGRARYLTKGDLEDDGRGGVSFTPRESEGDRLEFRLGVTIAP